MKYRTNHLAFFSLSLLPLTNLQEYLNDECDSSEWNGENTGMEKLVLLVELSWQRKPYVSPVSRLLVTFLYQKHTAIHKISKA